MLVCRKVKKLLPAFTHREVTAAQSKQIADHLSHCESCRLLAAQFAALAHLVSETPTPQAPAGFYQNFEREVLQRLQSTAAPKQESIGKQDWRLKPLLAGGGALLVLILCLLVWKLILSPPRPSLENYFANADFLELNAALSNSQERSSLLADSVSVDLLVETIQRLHQLPVYHGQLKNSISQWLIAFRHDRDKLTGTRRNEPQVLSIRSANHMHAEYDLDQIIRLLKAVRRFRSRVTLNELLFLEITHLKT